MNSRRHADLSLPPLAVSFHGGHHRQPQALPDMLLCYMPPKIRELVADLEKAGFVDRGGKGSHRNFVHPKVARPVTISDSVGTGAKAYQIRAVRRAIEESRK